MGHMRQDHNTKLSDTQLRALANRNARKMADLFTTCPLCGIDKKTAEDDLESHITGHLRSLALKSLPSYKEEMEPEDEDENDDSGLKHYLSLPSDSPYDSRAAQGHHDLTGGYKSKAAAALELFDQSFRDNRAYRG
ncbi:hypothetical protein CTA1_527 [Colletotrichum tanaceti]|uniref:Uncharacterized protein n=1 Tax=Colletotrichum tanaceti TaxID=1306861 RepID=A0A4U6XAW9_9PEZI|nr:hypothetical protein CTA1_527 [Colletotrichum tanaceti]